MSVVRNDEGWFPAIVAVSRGGELLDVGIAKVLNLTPGFQKLCRWSAFLPGATEGSPAGKAYDFRKGRPKYS